MRELGTIIDKQEARQLIMQHGGRIWASVYIYLKLSLTLQEVDIHQLAIAHVPHRYSSVLDIADRGKLIIGC